MACGAGRHMRGSRGLSLRTRLLLLQLAVTAVLLLVLGIVSTNLFAHNLTSQFNLGILDESTRNPSDIRQRPAPQLSAVQVTFSPFSVERLQTGRSPVSHALAAAIRKLGQAKVYQRARRDDPFPVRPMHGIDYHLTAVARVIPATENFPRSISVLVVAEQQSRADESGTRSDRRRDHHRRRPDRPASTRRPMADRARTRAARPDGQDRQRHHDQGRPDRADGRTRRPDRGRPSCERPSTPCWTAFSRHSAPG